jgi:hypothetical protein
MHLMRLFALVGVACSLSAGAPIAKITAVTGLLINDKPVPDKTAPTWPVIGNDVVSTTTNSAVLVLPKGDRALLGLETSIRLLERDGVVTLELAAGELCLLINRASNLQVFASGADLTIPHPFEGSVTLRAPEQKAVVKEGGCRVRTGAFLTSKKVWIPAAAAAASVIAIGQAVTPASPSRP